MNKKGLRLGNLIQDGKGKPFKIEELTKEGIKAYSGMITQLPLNPILLTEKWLQDFGFQAQPLSFDKCISEFPNTERKALVVTEDYVAIRNGKKHKPSGYDELIVVRNSDMKGKMYVHELQNLYFVLTGKELTLIK